MSHGHRPAFSLMACLSLVLASACGSEPGSATADERAALATRNQPRIGPVLPVAVVPRPVGTDFSEGIAVSKHGDVYFGLALSGGIYRRAPGGAISLIARLPTGNGVLLGLALDERDVLYAALASFDDSTSGVWSIAEGGMPELIMAMGAATIPNALAFDEQGNLYATDSAGTIWRLARDGTGAVWSASELLRGIVGSHGFATGIGANGIAYRQRALYVMNSDTGRVVRVGIARDGTAEPAQIWFGGGGIVLGDGIQFDAKGNLYVADQDGNQLVRITPQGVLEVLVTANQSPLFLFPTSLAFGRRAGDQRTLYITAPSAFVSADGVDVVSVENDIPGVPLP